MSREPRVRKRSVAAANRSRLLDHLLAHGSDVPISPAPACIRPTDAYETILALVCDGSVVVDIDRRLSPETPIRLPRAEGG